MGDANAASLSFVARVRNFFGMLPGQTLTEFGKELNTLTPEDKLELHRLFNEAGLPTDPPIFKTVTPAGAAS